MVCKYESRKAYTISEKKQKYDYNRSYTLPLDIKYTKLKKLKEYKINYNCGIDVTQDYEYSLSETLKHMDNHFDDNTIIDEIARCIKQGKLIDVNTYRNTKLFNVIDAFNDYICVNGTGVSEEVGTRYSEMKK